MANSIADKLRIKPGYGLLTINAPADFKKGLSGLPTGVSIDPKLGKYDQVHWFVMNKAELDKQLGKVMKLLKPEVTVWVYYPKGSSRLQTDLTRDKGWDKLLANGDQLTWISLISFNETWSVFGFRSKTDKDRKKDAKPAQREIFNWIDAEKKEVRLPVDVSKVFKQHKKEADFFQTLSFTNRKEYLEWIVTAKREETRKERIAGTIERLGKGWKNPRNL